MDRAYDKTDVTNVLIDRSNAYTFFKKKKSPTLPTLTQEKFAYLVLFTEGTLKRD